MIFFLSLAADGKISSDDKLTNYKEIMGVNLLWDWLISLIDFHSNFQEIMERLSICNIFVFM